MNRLKELREEKDLNQTALGKICGVAQNSYSRYELETFEIPINSLKLLSNYYNISIDYILYRTDVREPYNKNNSKDINSLKYLRKRVNKTQKEIAYDLHIPLKTYIKYEYGTISLNIQLLNLFADYYSTSIDFIVCNTNDITPHKRSIVDWNF